jgi:hypothetical protein
LQSHTFTFCIWLFLRIVETVDAHSGFRLPFAPWQLLDSVQVLAPAFSYQRGMMPLCNLCDFEFRVAPNDTIFTIPTFLAVMVHFSVSGIGSVARMSRTELINLGR